MLVHWPKERLNTLYGRMRADFPANERPPRTLLKKQVMAGQLKAYAFQTQMDEAAAYALCAGTSAVLITHLAVSSDARGQGIGSLCLDALAKIHQKAHALLIVEVERPKDGKDAKERALRQRRIAFYERAGYTGYPSVPYVVFGVPMMLMAKALGQNALPSAQALQAHVLEAYKRVIPRFLMNRVSFTQSETGEKQ